MLVGYSAHVSFHLLLKSIRESKFTFDGMHSCRAPTRRHNALELLLHKRYRIERVTNKAYKLPSAISITM